MRGGSAAEYRRAVELAPNDGYGKFPLGNQLAVFGELEQAIALTREALATEPLRAGWYGWLGRYLSGQPASETVRGAGCEVRSGEESQSALSPPAEGAAFSLLRHSAATRGVYAAHSSDRVHEGHMSPAIVALVFSPLAVIAAWAIKRDLETGVTGDSLYRFRADTNPIGFLVLIGGKAFVIILWIAFVLHACGWVGDPVKALRPYFEPFH